MEMEVLKYVSAGLACLGMIGAGIGVGQVFSALLDGIARNPSVESKLFSRAFIGAALAEGLGILAFLVALILIFVV